MGLGFGVKAGVWGLGFRVKGFGFRLWGSGGVWGLGFRVKGFRVKGLGPWV